MSLSPPDRISAALSAFRHPGYGEYYVAQFISNIGNHVQGVAQAWLIYRLTGSPELLGLVAFVNQLPFLLLGPFAGAIADRFDRRRIMLITHALSLGLAGLLATSTAAGWVTPAQILAVAALSGIVAAIDIPTRQALLREIVGLNDLPRAVALNLSMLNAARMIGPAIGSGLILWIGEGGCFLINGLSYGAVIICLLRLVPIEPAPAGRAPPFLQSVREGFAYVRQSPSILLIMLIGTAAGLFAMPYGSLLPVFADQILKGGPQTLGLLISASGVGAFFGAIGLTLIRQSGSGLWISASTAVFGLCVALFALSTSLWLSLGIMLVTGVAQIIQMTTGTISVQNNVPDHLRGRVLALYGMVQQGTPPFGALLAGLLAGQIGAVATLTAGGLLCLTIGAAFLRKRRLF